MNPLSPFTYYRRHKRSAMLLVALVMLATMVLYTIVGVLDSLTMQLDFSYLSRLSRVHPDIGHALEPGVVSQIQAHPDVARVIWDNGLLIFVPTLGGIEALHVIGTSQGDVEYLMTCCGLRLKEGRLLEPRTSEFMLSEETARALRLEIGDRIARSVSESYYENVLEPLVLVGLLEADPAMGAGPGVRVGFVSYEYLEGHELYAPRMVDALVVARQDRKEAVDEFLETTIASARTEVETYRDIIEMAAQGRRFLYLTFGIVNCLVAVAVAVVVGVINQIALMRRVSELGLLNALGHHRNTLVRRLTLETAGVASLGWVAGLILALLILSWLKANLYYSRGMELDLANRTPLWFVFPIPLMVVALAVLSLRRLFAQFDAVAIVERGKLSTEEGGHRRGTKRSSDKPLSSWTFYLRHRRRGIVLVVSAALVIVGVALPVFLFSAVADAMEPNFEYLRYVSRITPNNGRAVDSGVMGQIRSHPAVVRVIPVMSLGLQVDVPPSGVMRASIYGARESDLSVLVDLFEMDVKEGRMPRPRSNEVVLSESVALNRGLHIGDRIGVPIYSEGEFERLDVDDVPTEMVVVGILRRGSGQEALRPRAERSRLGWTSFSSGMWLGLASYEYLESHELTSSRAVHQLVVPADGRKDELDDWLEGSVASAQTYVGTYDVEYCEHQRHVQGLILIFAVVGCVTAAVAAIAMATLNAIFFAQRQEEFGILHAVGRIRLWLVLRTMKETGTVIALAWLMGAVICWFGLVCLQTFIYAPKGLSLNFSNLTPWVLTFPVPLAVVVVGTGTVARTLSKLDPVSIIERR